MGMQKKKRSIKQKRPKGIIDAIFTSTQQKVLGLLFGNPYRKFFATELIGLAGIGSGAVQRELQSLTECGLVSAERQRNLKYYQANASSPIFEELHRIILKTIGLAGPLREAILKAKANIEVALVYGSVAKGTDKASSDIDLLLVSEDLILEDLYEVLRPAEQSIGRKINPTLYTPKEFRKRIADDNPFLKKVLGGELMLLIGEEHVFAKSRKSS
jgi:predicted nucleotidyltransferase